jgi:PAS domain S-box-containing protein
MREALPELAGQGVFERMDKVFASGKPFVGRRVTASLRRRPGGQMEQRSHDLVYQPIRDPDGAVSGIFVNGLDVTERVAAEKRLRRMNEILERLVTARTRERDRLWRSSQDLLVAVDAQGIFRAANPAWTTILGWDEEEVVGRNHHFFVHPEDRELSQLALELALGRDRPVVETRCLHKDGTWRWIGWAAARDDDLVYASGRHITAQKEAEAELAAAQAALRQSQKMEAIGQLTGGVAHDFNNMLAIVIGGLDLASRRLRRGETGIERYLESAHDSASRAATLTQRLLAFSRQSPLAPTVLVVNSLVASMSELLRSTLGERVALETVLAGGLWAAHVDPNQLESAIVNLAVNARDAMLYGGKLTIETANTALDDRYAAKEVGVPAGQYVMIAVTDTGMGMTAEVLEKAFDPFFTTKPVGKGTGLGLSMVYGFARQSGGHVRAYSEPGMGTVVKIYLPRHYGSPRDEAAVSRPLATLVAGDQAEVVLVVEDEDGVRRMSVEAIAELGYGVHAVASGEEALTLFDTLERVDVLFTDIVMPGMTGRQLADILKRKAPNLKVLYTTGYTRNAIVHNGVLDPGVALLSKPFTVSDLALKLREVIDG